MAGARAASKFNASNIKPTEKSKLIPPGPWKI